MKVNTWKDMDKKYPMEREEMTEIQHKEFVEDCFNLYEKEGFAKVFWSPHETLDDVIDIKSEKYKGKPFKVISRVDIKDADIECLPMWKIQFEDGFITSAYPEEIIPREMKDNGCDVESL